MAALVMNNLNKGALPTNTITDQNKIDRDQQLRLFNHYLAHRGIDIPNGNKKSSPQLVIKSIVNKFVDSYTGNNSYDFFDDLLSEAKIIVWSATEKYLFGITKNKEKDGKKVKIKINYKEKWDFCQFASEQVKYGLRTHLYQLNINRPYGKLPDSDSIRKLYYILPKFKFDNPSLDRESRYIEISKKYNIDIKTIKLVDGFIIQKTTSFDAPINSEDKDELSQIIPDDDSVDSENAGPALRDINNQEAYNKFKELTQTFLKNLPSREREILERTRIKEDSSFIELSKKFNISAERVRQIAESNFEKFKLFIIKHKKDLERILWRISLQHTCNLILTINKGGSTK